MPSFNKTIWTSEDGERQYLIPDDARLRSGNYRIRTAAGGSQDVDAKHAEEYFVTSEQAKNWLKIEFAAVLSELRSSFRNTFEKHRNDFPDELMKGYADRTGDTNKDKLAELLNVLSDSSEVLPDRFKARMHEIAEKLRTKTDEPAD